MTEWQKRVEEKLDELLERTVASEHHRHSDIENDVTRLRLYVARVGGILAAIGVGLEVFRETVGRV